MPSAKKTGGGTAASTPRRAPRAAATRTKAVPRRASAARKTPSSGAKASAALAATHAAPTTIAPPEAAKVAAAPRRAARPAAGPMITIEQFGSGIGCIVRQKRTLRALGLRRPRQRVVRPDNPAVRGMVKSIPHLVRIVEGA